MSQKTSENLALVNDFNEGTVAGMNNLNGVYAIW